MATVTRSLSIIANGKTAGDPRLRAAVKTVRDRGYRVAVSVTWEAGDAARFAAEASQRGCDAVVAAGGDGAVNEVAGGLVAAGTPTGCAMGVLPMGTANDFAKGCGLPSDLTAGLLAIAEGVPKPIDAGRVNDRTFVNVATGGFGTRVTVETPPEVKRLLGRVAYLVAGVARIGQLQAREIAVTAPDFQWQGRTYVFAVGNGRQAGGGFQLCEHALLDDGLLDLMIVPDVPYDQVLTLLRDLLQPPPRAKYDAIIYRQVPRLEISAAGGLWMNLDGEPVYAERLRFEALPARLSLCLPPGAPVKTAG
ncbi:MAG: lipid kinase YegS [Planctomycetia bacterium]|nr:lipid kinase YegS [Planctomycetia bacterium]